MDQPALFLEDMNDAMREIVKRCGGAKAVGVRLWPEKSLGEAQNYLNDCLNVARPAKLSPEQVLLLLKWAHEVGYHGAINFITSEIGYSHPTPLEPEDEYAKLQREYINAVKVLATLTPKMEDLRAKLTSVRT